MMLEDGTGTGSKAEVDSRFRLRTRSIISTYQQDISNEKGEAYIASLGNETTPTYTITAAGGYVMYLQNTSTDYKMILARSTITTSALMEIVMMRNPDIGALANNRTIVPINKNFGIGKLADATCIGWDEVGDQITGITGGDSLGTYQVDGVERLLLDESTILSLNDIIALKAKNAGELSAVFHFYYRVPASRSDF